MSSKKVILVTGPPGNGRDQYLKEVIPLLEKEKTTGYYHIFEYMQKTAPTYGIFNLTRENVLSSVSKTQLDQIREAAFSLVSEDIKKSENDIEIVSTPSIFHIRPWGDYRSGTVDGLTSTHIDKIQPTCIIVFIDDLLRVRENLRRDSTWKRMELTLNDLANWRNSAIEMIEPIFESRPHEIPWLIYAKEHPFTTLRDILLGTLPRIYISFPITGEEDFTHVDRFIGKLNNNFICINPYTIKDWIIVKEYDNLKEKLEDKDLPENIDIKITYTTGEKIFRRIPIQEIEDAIDIIRTQIVDRDLQIITSVHATVVYHLGEKPSY